MYVVLNLISIIIMYIELFFSIIVFWKVYLGNRLKIGLVNEVMWEFVLEKIFYIFFFYLIGK